MLEARERNAVLAWCAARKAELHQQAAATNAELRVVERIESEFTKLTPAGHFADPVLEANVQLARETIDEEIEEGQV